MNFSIFKFFKYEVRSSRVAYQEHLQTGTTTTRKEKSVRVKEQSTQSIKDQLHGAKILLNRKKVPKPKDMRVQKLAMELGQKTKEADLLSNWSDETLCGDGKSGCC